MTPEFIRQIKTIVIAIIVIGGGLLMATKAVHYLNAPERELNPVVESMVRNIAMAKWSDQVLNSYATPEFQEWLLKYHTADAMQGFSLLGKVKKYNGIQKINARPDFAVMIAAFQFERGEAYITLQMAKRQGRWLIYSFNVQSPALQAPPAALAR